MQHNEILGFTDQSDDNKVIINSHKQNEERIMRQLDNLQGAGQFDNTALQEARIRFIDAFMWMNRAVFQPQRIELPEDRGLFEVDEANPKRPPVHVGEVFRHNEKDGKDKTEREVMRSANGRELVARGPHWYAKDDVEAYEKDGGRF